jgi:phage protein D
VVLLLNDPPCSYRYPRLRVLANGLTLTGAYEVEVNSNNHYSADRFDVVLALGDDPRSNACFWSSESRIVIDIQLSLDGESGFISLILGLVDTVSVDLVGGTVQISGRDFVADLIGAQTLETFSNRTSSEIAIIFAQRHGLTPHVVATTTPIGRFYQSDHEGLALDTFSKGMTEWDMLVYLAREEFYDVFVTGNDLHFQPATQSSATSRVLRPVDMMELKLERALTLARDLQITVRSWNSFKQTAVTECATSTINGGVTGRTGVTSTSPQCYVVVRPNLTPDKALSIAQQHLSEISRHERVIEFTMPGELTLTPRSIIRLDGTRTDFDQAYYIDSIERAFRPHAGFVQRIHASNSSPRSVSIAGSTS